ncbi:MAG TPA: MarR family transcriptional regulator [Anaerovoracaceae bacterium]|nr:MarR family transcriptional regulator [Anaerovoracaceae bacterium]
MNRELMQTVSESLIKLRFLVVTHFMKPMRERERERCEFPPGYMHVMGWLKSKGAPVSMTDLASASFVSKPNLTTMVDRLCADGLVERSADVNDRRIVNVALTQKGLDFLCRHKAETAAFVESRLSLLDDAALEKLKHAVDDIADILDAIGEKQADNK